ncbi:amino acid adenylation domain-containing protein [Amycolatopsis sp. NPDC051716]|uniref:amino acid adenylation domain-containing protein n=1 Tax=Amycolatopsis sp. NPDC051716 TaxID=3155804 RepID=UPI00342511BD
MTHPHHPPAVAPTLAGLVEAQVRRAPDAVAVVMGEDALTYAELNRRANRLAGLLIERGIGPEQRVAVLLPRGFELVVALLAVLKSGAASVPVDPEYPAARIEAMLADARPSLTLTTGSAPVPGAVIRLDRTDQLDPMAADPARFDGADPAARASALSPAYVMYTSGSTGRPKGVVVPHAAVLNLLRWKQAEFGFGPRDRFLQKTPISFDASVWELWSPLLAGGTLVLAEPGAHRDPGRITELVRRHGVTLIQFVPSMLDLFLSVPDVSACTSLRHVFAGGEALSARTAGRFREVFAVPLHNLYGPTETAVDVSFWTVTADPGPVPIGRPVWNTGLHVLDAALKPVAPGVDGELYVAGVQLARGYLGDPARTAQRFVASPFTPGERLYRTGDLARRRPDGAIEFRGRTDQQVKVRGFRVELGEVEAALAAQPGVARAAVVVGEDPRGVRYLAGYVMAADDDGVDPAVLRRALRASLPEYLVPSVLAVVSEFPLTPSGKLDARRLLAGPVTRGRTAARTPAEETLCELFADALGLDEVGADEDFFALGGHSLSATRLLWRVNERFGVELPLSAIFDAPSAILLADRVPVLPGRAAAPAPIPAGTAMSGVPSFAQERLWLIDQLTGAGAVYNLHLVTEIEGPLDVDALGRSISACVTRHETLRTCLESTGGALRQVVHPAEPLRLGVTDLRTTSAGAPRATVDQAVADLVARPFALDAGPLLRADLLRTAEERHVLVIVVHHVAADAQGLDILAAELAAGYRAALRGDEPSLPPLPVRYADYAAWQRERLAQGTFDADLAYWRDRLAGLPVLDLPTDHPRPPAPSHRGACHHLDFGPAFAGRLRDFGRQEGASLFMVLLAAFLVAVGRRADQSDVVIGTAAANRGRPETEDLIGFFVNLLAIRVDLASPLSLRDAVRRTVVACKQAYDHQAAPFERVVQAVGGDRDPSRHPLFQVVFQLLGGPHPAPELPGLRTRPLPVDTPTAPFDLLFTVVDAGTGLSCEVRYASDLWGARTVERMAGEWHAVLAAILDDPGRDPWDVPLLSPADRALLDRENAAAAAVRPAGTVVDLVRRRVAAAGDRIALADPRGQWTYRELDRRAGALAAALVAAGVRPDAPVGLLFERSADLVIAMLGVLKAGAAYLVLDPAYPAERLALMVRTARPAAVVTRGAPPPWVAVPSVPLDGPAPAGPRPDGEAARPDGLAAVVFTSGSTGHPKAVGIPHRGIVRLVADPDYVGIAAGDVVLHLGDPAFDITTFEVWGALAHGARVEVLPGDRPLGPDEVLAAVRDHRPAVLSLTATLFNQVVDVDPGGFAGVRHLFVVGEVMDPGRTATVLRAGGPRWLHNGYGPTENTTFATCHRMERPPEPGAAVPIGRAIGGTTLHVLDRRLRRVPPGVPGELYVGGHGLARGYAGRPGATARRFVADPFGPPGSRMYATGDRVCRAADGTLRFLGRLDRQVKVRGHRVEPGEIEAAVLATGRVRECAVTTVAAGGDRRLVAYLVLGREEAPTAAQLREELARRLPAFLVPNHFVLLDRLPTTASGKLDTGALPGPAAGLRTLAEAAVAPRTPHERALWDIWADALEIDGFGVHDDFFALGGHSLLATVVMARVREGLGPGLPLRTLFDHPTIAGLAQVVGTRAAAPRGSDDELDVLIAELTGLAADPGTAHGGEPGI